MAIIETISRTVLITLICSVGLVLLCMLLIGLRNRIIAKMGLRNIPRRPTQSGLIVLGLTLSTVIIVAALATGDTLSYSIQRQATDAYGQVDEVLAPPILGTLMQLGLTTNEGPDAMETSALLNGGVDTVLELIQNGLPGIDESRFDELAAGLADNPQVDGVAPTILFPIIVRNRTTGQGEPYGFLFAVDNSYVDDFGLVSVDGRPLDVESLAAGAGNVISGATSVVDLLGTAAVDTASQLSIEDADLATVTLGAVGAGALLVQLIQNGSLQNIDLTQIDFEALLNVPIDPDALTLENLDLNALANGTATLDDLLTQIGIDPETIDLDALGLDNIGLDQLNLDSIGLADSTPEELAQNLFGNINFNTLGEDLDGSLEVAGLQVRQGEIYLSRLGAERLDARPGDLLDVYIGPIPFPYRVAEVVDQAGPLSSLAPVIVMNIDEAQRLLFMEDRVNGVLVSNTGDSIEGLALTDEVSDSLRELALNDDAIRSTMALLAQPDIRPRLERQVREIAEENPFMEGGEVPEFLAGALDETFNVRSFTTRLQTVVDSLDSPEITPELRTAFADRVVQVTLLGAEVVPPARQQELTVAISGITELELLDFLNKETVLNVANVGGDLFSSVFSIFGFFSILAGILLIFMIFTMLAAERRGELGVARAVGMQRRQVIQMFVTEGLVYDLLAAAVGILLGLVISYTMVGFIGGMFDNVAERFRDIPLQSLFQFRFNANTSSLVIAYCLGVLFTFVIVFFASVRASQLNIIAAIRDLPEESFRTRPHWQRWARILLGAGLLALAAFLYWRYNEFSFFAVQGSATLALFGLALLITGLLSYTPLRYNSVTNVVGALLGIGLLVIWATPWSRYIERFSLANDPAGNVLGFMATGPLIILGAILAIMFNAQPLLWLINKLLGGVGSLTPVLRTAVAYPLNTRFRTGLAMLLFAMIISTVTIMAVVIEATQSVVTPPEERNMGFDIEANGTLLSFFNPVEDLAAEIEADPEFDASSIDAVGKIGVGWMRVARAMVDGDAGRLVRSEDIRATGVNVGYYSQTAQFSDLRYRAPGFDSDDAVWAALQERDDVALVEPEWLERWARAGDLPAEGDVTMPYLEVTFVPSPAAQRFRAIDENGRDENGIPLPPVSATTGITRTVWVIGVLDGEDEFVEGRGFIVRDSLLEDVSGEPLRNVRQYVAVANSADMREVSQRIESKFIGSGINTTVLEDQFAAGQAITRGVLRLFQGFMGLGLLVGIAALGVISSRMVVERRQQIGMLRAIGYQPNMVALSFVLEASFIALAGIAVGVITGVVLGRNIVGELFAVITEGQTLPIPWLQIGVIVLIAYLFSLLTTIIPALQASRIYPAEALRYD